MNWTLAPVLGFSLAMDVFAVSIAIVLCMGTVGAWAMIRVAGVFGFFQGAMPLVGWLLAYRFASVISSFDHWVAFVLLVAVGAKTIYEGVKNGEDCNFASDPTRGWLLVVLAVGTSLDALAVGVS
ncbi:MAG: manganese efflux pump, partial [Synergistota bacterium]|nr:manganese efflux pump [Synergistota bacterium]